jgi:hypothetical protein
LEYVDVLVQNEAPEYMDLLVKNELPEYMDLLVQNDLFNMWMYWFKMTVLICGCIGSK